jgi:hypothetical protein
VLAPEAIKQEGDEEVRVPDITGAALTTTVALALPVPPALVQERVYVYVLAVVRTP